MAEIVLVHGAGLGSWIWAGVLPRLAQAGHRASAIDLPGRGGAPTTLAAQAAVVLAAAGPRAVLVGHSAGGFAITAAAEAAPDRVAGLIYLCAFIPRAGASIADLRREGRAAGLKAAYRVAPDRQSFAFDPEAAEALFYHDCPDPAGAAARMVAEPVAPQETALPSVAAAMALPRAAIFCQDDRAIPPALQMQMAAGIATTARLPCGHAPFLAMPERLAGVISTLAGPMA